MVPDTPIDDLPRLNRNPSTLDTVAHRADR